MKPRPFLVPPLALRIKRNADTRTGATRVEREPAWPPTLTPYIVVSDARRAMDWYIEVFGAQRRGEVHINADDTIGHAEVGIVDPFGHRWMLLRRPARATRLRQGDVANLTMAARDAHRAKEFYEAILQVPFSSGHPGAWRTDEIRPPLGIRSSEDGEPPVQLSYRVDDIAAAVERVRAAGGHCGDPERKPYGLLAECVDDQGATFRLWQPAG
jgi:predicted enzyme related to lactoylglutathione lyase